MISAIFKTVLIEPIYNVFVFLINFAPAHDAGLAIIALTILVRLLFLPAFTQALRTQHGMRRAEPELDAIKEKYKDDKPEQARKTMELFRARNIKPFATFVALLIQLPIFIALYAVFLREGFPAIAHDLLYAFTPIPEQVGIVFLGLVDLTLKKNIALAALVAGLQFLQGHLSMGSTKKAIDPKKGQINQAVLIQRQMLYILPVVMAVVAYTTPAAAGLYLLTNAVISIIQELVVRKKIDAEFDALATGTEKAA